MEPTDPDAAQTKLFLLLQTEQYDAALSLIGNDGENTSHAFETAYSFYRLQRETEAKDIVQSIKDDEDVDSRGVIHLEAQLVRGLHLAMPTLTGNPRAIVKDPTILPSNYITNF